MTAAIELPASVLIRFNPADLPAGAPGRSVMDEWLVDNPGGTRAQFLEWMRAECCPPAVAEGGIRIAHSSLGPSASTTSITYTPTGLECTINVEESEKVLIDVRGMVNHNDQKIIHFTLDRNAAVLHAAPLTGLAVARIDIADGVRAVNLQHEDQPGPGTFTYRLLWRNHGAPAGVAQLGRRAGDAAMMVPTTMTLMVRQ